MCNAFCSNGTAFSTESDSVAFYYSAVTLLRIVIHYSKYSKSVTGNVVLHYIFSRESLLVVISLQRVKFTTHTVFSMSGSLEFRKCESERFAQNSTLKNLIQRAQRDHPLRIFLKESEGIWSHRDIKILVKGGLLQTIPHRKLNCAKKVVFLSFLVMLCDQKV